MTPIRESKVSRKPRRYLIMLISYIKKEQHNISSSSIAYININKTKVIHITDSKEKISKRLVMGFFVIGLSLLSIREIKMVVISNGSKNINIRKIRQHEAKASGHKQK